MSVVINRVTPIISVVSPSSAVGGHEKPPDSLINDSDDDESMLAAFLSTFAAQGQVANRIQVNTVKAPSPPVADEVVIAVKAASITVDDVSACQDTVGGGWFAHPRAPSESAPHIGGCDYAGVVIAVGPECKTIKPGDRVCGVQDIWVKQRPGTWAEKTKAAESEVVPLDDKYDGISFVEAAGTAMGAFVCADMYKRVKFQSGPQRRALILGASGALGSVMVQLLSKARSSGGGDGERLWNVTAVVSGANAAAARAAGADAVVDYTAKPFGKQLAGGEGFDAVFDFVGGPDMEASATPLLRKGGRFITAVGPMQNAGDRQLSCGEFTGTACGIIGRSLKSCMPCAGFTYEMSGSYPPLKPDDFALVAGTGGARTTVALEVPFSEASVRDAISRVASHHAGGRVVINFELM